MKNEVSKAILSFVIGTTVLCSVGWGLGEFVKYHKRPLYQRVEYLGKVQKCVQTKMFLGGPAYDIFVDGGKFQVRKPFRKDSAAYVVTRRSGRHSIYSYNPLETTESAVE